MLKMTYWGYLKIPLNFKVLQVLQVEMVFLNLLNPLQGMLINNQILGLEDKVINLYFPIILVNQFIFF